MPALRFPAGLGFALLLLPSFGCGSHHHNPVAPAAGVTLGSVTTTVHAAAGDTLSVRASDGSGYVVQIPAGTLARDTTVSLKPSRFSFTAIPGASEVVPALDISGLPGARDSIRVLVTPPPGGAPNRAYSVRNDNASTSCIASRSENAGVPWHVTPVPPLTSGQATTLSYSATNTPTTVAVLKLTSTARSATLTAVNPASIDLQSTSVPTVIMLHGWYSNSDAMSSLTSRVSARYPTLTLDYESTFNGPAQNADLLHAALQQMASNDLRSPLILVGYSMGGIVARELAKRHPEDHVQAIVFLATPNNGLTLQAENLAADIALTLLVEPAAFHALTVTGAAAALLAGVIVFNQPGPAALVAGNSDLRELNSASRVTSLDYYFLEGTRCCNNLVSQPADGLVSNAATDMSQYSPHEVATFHRPAKFTLPHAWFLNATCGDGVMQADHDMGHDVTAAGVGDSLMASLADCYSRVRLVPFGSPSWRYLDAGTSTPDTLSWKQAGFDDRTWSTGSAPFGFRSSSGSCPVTPASATKWPLFHWLGVRTHFTVQGTLTNVRLRGGVDNEVWWYVNGHGVGHVFRGGCATLADYNFPVSASYLLQGDNVLTGIAHDEGGDCFLDAELSATVGGTRPTSLAAYRVPAWRPRQ